MFHPISKHLEVGLKQPRPCIVYSSYISLFGNHIKHSFPCLIYLILNDAIRELGSRDGAVVRALVSHQCGPGSIPDLGVICGLSLLLILVPAPGTPVFLPPQKPTFQIPLLPENRGEKSHSVDSTEIPIFYFIFILNDKKSAYPTTHPSTK